MTIPTMGNDVFDKDDFWAAWSVWESGGFFTSPYGLYGDKRLMNSGTGGNDRFIGVDIAYLIDEGYDAPYMYFNAAYGDAFTMSGTAVGGRDQFHGGEGVSNTFLGDAGTMRDSARGGADSFAGATDLGNSPWGTYNTFVGDGEDMSGRSIGGNDVLTGSSARDGGWASNSMSGDASWMSGSAAGGRDVLSGGSASSLPGSDDGTGVNNWMAGDAREMRNTAKGGHDVIFGGGADGESAGVSNFIAGDADLMFGRALGGNDDLSVRMATDGGQTYNWLVGDGEDGWGYATGGNDAIQGGSASGGVDDKYDEAVNYAAGDFFYAWDQVTFGHDRITGGHATEGADVYNDLVGDAWEARIDPGQQMTGGDDTVTGGSADADSFVTNYVGGDVWHLYGEDGAHFVGGRDIVAGGNGGVNGIYGDVYEAMVEVFQGGADILKASTTGENWMYGDGETVWALAAFGGDDTLVSGAGDDRMWGDFGNVGSGPVAPQGNSAPGLQADGLRDLSTAPLQTPQYPGNFFGGADLFVFAPGNGEDVIYDFDVSDGDRIDVTALRAAWMDIDFNGRNDFANFAQMNASHRITYGTWTDDLVTDAPAAFIYTGNGITDDVIVLVGVLEGELARDDFFFG